MIALDQRVGGGSETDIQQRVPWIAAFILAVFALFFGRLFQLQVIQTDDLRMRSVHNSVRTLRVEAPRGDIVDRDGRLLATTRPAFGVQLIPHDVRHPDVVIPALAKLIDRDPAELRTQIGTPRGRLRFQPIRLAGDLSEDQYAGVESHLFALPGIVSDKRPRRHYVGGELAAHVLGYIGEIHSAQLESSAFADYQQGEVIGQAGIESVEQDALRGRAGGVNQIVDVAGRVVGDIDKIDPVPGGSVQLTIDLDLQQAAEGAFVPEDPAEHARVGAVVALDVHSGDVLALASKPSFDPNAFAGGIDAAIWRHLTADKWKPIQNRAISGQYPPGSTYKAIVAAAGLEGGVIDPKRRVYCPGYFRLGNRTYKCWKHEGHGSVDLHRALVESCDVYFYTVGRDLGIDRLAYFARAFSLGRQTGVPLPHEMTGLIPTSEWKEKRFREPWMAGETISASIGQGFDLVTPIQLAVAYGAIANGGALVRPRLVLRVADADGRLVDVPPSEPAGRVPVRREYLDLVRAALEGVVNEPGGTGARARVPGVRVAGKTGTAQVVGLRHSEAFDDKELAFELRDHAWFVGFAPAEAPEIVVAAVVEHGGHGGSAAGPVVQKVLARYFEKRAVQDVPAQVAWVAGGESGRVGH
ncbi:MAG TPA: penicillin-binding protein 2 [Myxococcota bacterium]|nr:penicillin-binding protein 2 [Myxococcota bacterium]